MSLSILSRLTALGTLAALSLSPLSSRAADHGDAPTPSNHQGTDIADVFFFLDPKDNDKVVIIATIRGFVTPGENSNFGIFDPGVRYRFEIENTNDTKGDKFIDVTFTPRTAVSGPATREILEVPVAQSASIKFTNFKDSDGGKIRGFSEVQTTNSSTAESVAPDQVNVLNLGGSGIDFFAGLVDDPFFFDIPAFGAYIKSVRDTGVGDVNVFTRARDSFAGYNVMGIAFRMPVSYLQKPGGTSLGLAFFTQRHAVESINKKTGEVKGTGTFKTFDRMGNPGVNVALIPFRKKNLYNQSTPKDDAKNKFAGDIIKTLQVLGTDQTNIDALAGVAVTNGDYLRLATDSTLFPNTGTNPEAEFPNGRRLRDDTIDILLGFISNGGLTTGDGVSASDPAPSDDFPFLAPPNQPFPNETADDKTQN